MLAATRRGEKYFTIKNKLLLDALQRVLELCADKPFALKPVFSLGPRDRSLANPDEHVLKIDDGLLEKYWNKLLIYTALDQLQNERGEDVSEKNKRLIDFLGSYLLSPYTTIHYMDVMASALWAAFLATGVILPVTAALVLILAVPLTLFPIIVWPVLGISAIATFFCEITYTFFFVKRDERTRQQQAMDNLSNELRLHSTAQGEEKSHLPKELPPSLNQRSVEQNLWQSCAPSTSRQTLSAWWGRGCLCEYGTEHQWRGLYNTDKGESQGFFVGGGNKRRDAAMIPMTSSEGNSNSVLEDHPMPAPFSSASSTTAPRR